MRARNGILGFGLFDRLLDAAVVSLLFAAAPYPAAAAARALSADEINRLEAGDVVYSVIPDPASSAALIDAVIDIPAPRHTLWLAMVDCSRMQRVITGLTSCRVIESGPQGKWDVREHIIDFAWFLPNVKSVFRCDYTLDTKIVFRRLSGDLTALEGEWILEPLAGGKATRLYYTNKVGINLPVPQFLVADTLKGDVPQMLKELRAETLHPGPVQAAPQASAP